MAQSKNKTKLYPLLEGALFDFESEKKENIDGKNYLRILEFDIKSHKFNGKSWKYVLEDNAHSIGDFNMIDDEYGLIIKRDDTEGVMLKSCKSGEDAKFCFDNPAKFKRVYKIKLDGDEAKKLAYIDLMNIQDPDKISRKPLEDDKFVFPFFTIEMLILRMINI